MRERKSARLLVVSPARNVLLFRFVHKEEQAGVFEPASLAEREAS